MPAPMMTALARVGVSFMELALFQPANTLSVSNMAYHPSPV